MLRGVRVTGTERQICRYISRCVLVRISMHGPQITLPPPGKAKPHMKQVGPTSGSFLHICYMDSGSSVPNSGLFKPEQLLVGRNSCLLTHDNLINLSKFRSCSYLTYNFFKACPCHLPGTGGHHLFLPPLISFSFSVLSLSLTHSVTPLKGGSPLGWMRSGVPS